MAQVGAVVISYRARYLRALSEAAAEYHAEFSGGSEALTLAYQTVSTVTDPFASQQTLFEQLMEHQKRHERAELDSGQCLSGPHKDDFEAAIGGRSVKSYGSQGQTRTASISLKLAERDIFRAETGEAPVLLLSQGNYPLKNLHTVLKALPAVLAQYPGAVLRVAGWPPLDKGPLLRPVIDWMFPYQTWCKQLIRRLGLADHVQYTGPLDAAAMRQAYLDADLFLLPSYSENSPNSLGEAMLLGLPCVASAAGGIPDMLQSGVQGMLYGAAGDDAALSAAILQVLALPDHGTALGTAAQIRARVTHDAAKNSAQLIEIYRNVLQREGTL